MFTIEKDIPVPSTGAGRPTIYPLGDMLVGDSFFIPLPEGKALRDLQGSVSRAAKAHDGKRFTTRKVASEDGKPTGIRVWRTD